MLLAFVVPEPPRRPTVGRPDDRRLSSFDWRRRAACIQGFTTRHPVKLPDQSARFTGFVTLATFVLVVAILKIAEEVLIPIALTVLLTFLLTPFVVRLTRWGFPKAIAILLTVTIAFGVIGGVSWIVFSQAVGLVQKLPDYQDNIRQKITRLKAPHGPDALGRMTAMIKTLQHDLDDRPSSEASAKKKAMGTEERPMQVEVKTPPPSSLQVARDVMDPVLAPLGTAAIVIVFVIAMLFQREDLRDRFINVVSAGRLNLATQALDDAARRVTRYLLMQLVVNATYGIPVGVCLYFIGVPNALLWGLLATLLRFIPFLGPWVAAAFPVVLAAAVDPGWAKLGYTVAVFLVMEVVSNNVVEPWLYGASTGISNLALMIAAVFWTWLWGVPGLFLSTPLTVCIMVLGKYLAGLQFLSVLLGSEPVLEPAAKLYQRMLSMDQEEMRSIARKFVEERSLEEFYDEVFLPALLMSEEDRHGGSLAEVRQKFIFEASRELIDELERRTDTLAEGKGDHDLGEGDSASVKTSKRAVSTVELDDDRLAAPIVFGIPGRDDADEVVALMLQHLLRLRGIETEVMPITANADDFVRWINQHDVRVAYVSALPPAALVGARQLIRRLKESCPRTRLLVGVWSREADFNDLQLRLRRPKPDRIATTLADAVRQIEAMLAPRGENVGSSDSNLLGSENSNTETPAIDESVESLRLNQVDPEELFGVVTRDLAQYFNVPMSLVTIATSDPQFWESRTGTKPEEPESKQTSATSQSIFPEETLIVGDVTKDKRFSSNPLLSERGVRFYAGVPLRSRAGRVVGTLSVVDTKPREAVEQNKAFLMLRAAELMDAVESRKGEPLRAETV